MIELSPVTDTVQSLTVGDFWVLPHEGLVGFLASRETPNRFDNELEIDYTYPGRNGVRVGTAFYNIDDSIRIYRKKEN